MFCFSFLFFFTFFPSFAHEAEDAHVGGRNGQSVGTRHCRRQQLSFFVFSYGGPLLRTALFFFLLFLLSVRSLPAVMEVT
jgi:hypothetical protein